MGLSDASKLASASRLDLEGRDVDRFAHRDPGADFPEHTPVKAEMLAGEM